jgi:hypothetical protein
VNLSCSGSVVPEKKMGGGGYDFETCFWTMTGTFHTNLSCSTSAVHEKKILKCVLCKHMLRRF